MNDLINIQPDLLRFARSLTKNDSAYDLVQDTNIRLIEKYDQFQPGTNFRKWSFSIMYHIFCDWKRREKPTEQLNDVKVPINYDYDNFDINKAIRNIKHYETRQAVILRFKFGLKYREISQVQEDSENTVKSRVRIGRNQILVQYEKN